MVDICPGGISHEGYCPVGICPGVFVQGVYVRGVYVVEPLYGNFDALLQTE